MLANTTTHCAAAIYVDTNMTKIGQNNPQYQGDCAKFYVTQLFAVGPHKSASSEHHKDGGNGQTNRHDSPQLL